MAFRLKLPLHAQTKLNPDHYDDPLGVDLPAGKPGYAPGGKIVTGLSEEEDAKRYMEQRFNPDLRFCPNCEAIEDVSKRTEDNIHHQWCAYCGCHLAPMGTPPRKRKYTR